MGIKICSIFEYYYGGAASSLVQHPLPSQLDALRGCRILLLDYCGMSHSYIKAFRSADARIFLVGDTTEDLSAVIPNYDVVYVMVCDVQQFIPAFRSILVVFRRKSILKMQYVP